MSTWLPEAHTIEETALKTLEGLGFKWIEAEESLKRIQDDCILLGFYIHPITSRAFAAVVAKTDNSIIGRKYLYYCETNKTALAA